jgi:hypothetical protein
MNEELMQILFIALGCFIGSYFLEAVVANRGYDFGGFRKPDIKEVFGMALVLFLIECILVFFLPVPLW